MIILGGFLPVPLINTHYSPTRIAIIPSSSTEKSRGRQRERERERNRKPGQSSGRLGSIVKTEVRLRLHRRN
jgi:hypothetical protein